MKHYRMRYPKGVLVETNDIDELIEAYDLRLLEDYEVPTHMNPGAFHEVIISRWAQLGEVKFPELVRHQLIHIKELDSEAKKRMMEYFPGRNDGILWPRA